MKRFKALLFLGLFSFFFVALLSARPDDQHKNRNSRTAQIIDADTYLNINALLCFIANQGNFAYDFTNVFGKTDGLYYPRGTDKTVLYSAGIWVGARVDGSPRIAMAEYSTEFVPGPMENGTFLPDSPDFRVYKINRGDNASNNPDYADWPSDMGAPVDDLGNPKLYGDQTCWAVYNDADPNQHTNNSGNTQPLGIEIQQTSFAYGRSGPLGNTIYLKYLIINKSENTLEDTYVSLWADPDVGFAGDDLVGCDTALSLGYSYNGDETDAVYGSAPPAVGFDFLQGPIAPGDPSDSAFFMGEWISGYRNLPMTSFNKYINSLDPNNSQETYYYMQGLLANGNPVVDPDGDTTTFFVAGDPVAGTGWIDNAPADRRMMMSSGPFTMLPGDTQEVVAAIIVAQGADRLASITKLKDIDQQVQAAYNFYFDIPEPPPNFTVYGRGLDGAIDLTWTSEIEDYYQEFIDQLDEFYVFEGYNIYQGESEYGPWHKVATFDMTASQSMHEFEGVAGPYIYDCYEPGCDSTLRPWNFALIYNWIVNPETGGPELRIVQEGNESGIQNHILIDEDMISGGPIINGMPYYFAVTGYTVNIQDVRSEDSVFVGNSFLGFNAMNLENLIQPLTVTPLGDVGLYSDTALHATGPSQGIVVIEYLDPGAVIPGSYLVGFNPDGSWYLMRDDIILFDNQTNQSGDYDYPIVDGMMVRVIGPTPGIAPAANDWNGGIIEIETPAGPIEPDNVFWSYNSTGDYYVSSDVSGSSDAARARFNWYGLMGVESWEFRFTAEGSEYYDWTNDEKFPNRAPFEVWHFNAGDDTPDRRDFFFIIDDDDSGGWSPGDRIYIMEDPYFEPAPANAGMLYNFPDDFHLGRTIFNLDQPAEGTIVRFNSTIPNSEVDTFTFVAGGAGSCGDVNFDTEVNITDAVFLINYVFLAGPEPYILGSADVNCDGKINITDIVYIINYIFRGGYDPCDIDGNGQPDCG
jgi:hypothetical protein